MEKAFQIIKVFILSVIGLLACGVIGFFVGINFFDIGTKGPAIEQHAVAKESEKTEEGRRTNVLVLGVDARPGEKQTRSDTNMLLSIDPQLNKAVVISIPRDTKITVSGADQKFAVAHALGGVQMAVNKAEELLHTHIDHYVTINFDGFADIVDLLGGVTLEVEQRMHKPSEGIDLQPGLQKLNGKDALAYVRFRGDPTADIGRTQRQQKFVKAMAEEILQGQTIFKIPALVNGASELMVTDMSNKEMLQIAMWGINITPDDIVTQTLPGVFEDIKDEQGNLLESYWKPSIGTGTRLLSDLYEGKEKETFSGQGVTVQRESTDTEPTSADNDPAVHNPPATDEKHDKPSEPARKKQPQESKTSNPATPAPSAPISPEVEPVPAPAPSPLPTEGQHEPFPLPEPTPLPVSPAPPAEYQLPPSN